MSRPDSDNTLTKRAFAFPGVGVRLCGHEAAFFDRHATVMAPMLDEGSERGGVDLRGAFTDESTLTELQGQLFTFSFDVAVAQVYLDAELPPTLGAGHSMGIYAALAAAGVISFAEGLGVVEVAYRCVEEAAAGQDGAMAVVVGLSGAEVGTLLAERPLGDTALKVNSNNDTTFVFAGRKADLLSLVDEALRRDALKARLLPVTAPYHHPLLLAGASEAFELVLRQLDWSHARWPIVSSIDQRLLVEAEDLLDLTVRNLSTPIDWSAVVGTMAAEGIELILECGPGLSLSQNGRLIDGCPRVVTVKNAKRRLGL